MAKLHIYLILTPIAALLWLAFLQQHWQFPLSHTRHQISNSSHDDVGPTDITLTLKTIYHHASPSGPYPGLFRKLDMPPATLLSTLDRYHLRPAAAVGQAYPITTKAGRHYLYDVYRYNGARRRLRAGVVNTFIQETTQVPLLLPDVTHRPSVLQLAMMTNNAYSEVDNNSTDWYDLGDPWKLNSSFGWQSNGIRGHVFGNKDDSLLVISIKGTSAGLWGGGPTGEKDKLNDNMLFSCCCGRISRAWTPVCDCFRGSQYRCETFCLQKNIENTELYYDHAMAIYMNVADRYPEATIWLTGHSLGGALASLVGQTFLVPTVTFEIPGDSLASRRLHLPHPPGVHLPLWHFGHTADPIFVGVCTGPRSSCWYGGFAMETRCHTGKVCVWDTVNDKGWRVDIRSHRIQDVIENILKRDENEFPLPACVPESKECEDCGLWEFFDERDNPPSQPTTTSAPATCTRPGPPDDPWQAYP